MPLATIGFDEPIKPRPGKVGSPNPIVTAALDRFTQWVEHSDILTLKDHQLDGMDWCLRAELASSSLCGIRGGILADEMGLGKTVLMCGLILANPRPRTLVVVPPALLKQWCACFLQFFNHNALVYHGAKVKKISDERLASTPLVITTYGMIAGNRACRLRDIGWDRAIYDEAHHLRNPNTSTYKGAVQLMSQITWMVTGTPLQNDTMDVLSLLRLLGCNSLPAQRVKLADVETVLEHHLLRRTKKQASVVLPPVVERVITCPWLGPQERRLAQEIHSLVRFANVNIDNVDDIIAYLSHNPLPAMMRARQMCVFPLLMKPNIGRLKRRGRIPAHLHLRATPTCSKVQAIVGLLRERATNNRRKIVFCHFRGEIDILAACLHNVGIRTLSIDGRSSAKERRAAFEPCLNFRQYSSICKKWYDEPVVYDLIAPFLAPDVLLVQIQTGNEGLNLQHYQEVYFTSPHWNPAIEEQAIARVHRIGQTEAVNVFRFVMDDISPGSITLDKYCQLVQDAKRHKVAALGLQ
jgi:SNF2 family DNA or RNA helicase